MKHGAVFCPLLTPPFLPLTRISRVQECERLGCTANSEMVRQLVRRSQLLSPLPRHRTQGLTRHEMLEAAFAHLDVDGSGELEAHEIVSFCRGINPTNTEDELKEMLTWMDKDGDARISKAEYMQAMDFLTTILTDDDFEHGVLETLATKPSMSDMPNRRTKLTALFKHLDVDGGGSLELDELMAVADDANPAADRAAAKAQLAWLDDDGDKRVSAEEFVDAMEFMTSYLSDEDFDASLEELMAYEKFTYRCDAAFLGRKGVAAMLPVLRADQTFTGLVLRGCGVRNDGVAALADALSGHPSLSYLDVGDNPISEGGVEALARLCAATPSLKDVLYDGCYFVRGWSNVSTDLAADPNTGGAPLAAAVERNRNPPPPPPTGEDAVAAMDVAELLRSRRGEVKALFHALAGVDGRVSFRELRDGLAERGEEWGFLSEHFAGFISPEHIFGPRGGGGGDVDGAGEETLSYAEFAKALRSEGTRAKVLQACRRRRVELKVLFYTLAGGDGTLTMEELVAGLEEALEDQAEDWGFTAAEMRTVFAPEILRAGGERGGEDEGGVEDADATAGAGDFDGDGKLSWAEFYTKLAGLQ